MNPNDSFEDQLRRQALRSIPAEWKQCVLPPINRSKTEPIWSQFWTSIFHPYRHAYAVVAALWLVIAFLLTDTPASSSPPGTMASTSPPLDSKSLALWHEKQLYLALATSNPTTLEYIIR